MSGLGPAAERRTLQTCGALLMRAGLFALFVGFFLTAPLEASATTIVRIASPASILTSGEYFVLELRADLGAPSIGFGLDLTYDTAIITLTAPPAIGPLWTAVSAADEDGLAGVSFSGVAGGNVLLATLYFQATALGETLVSVDTTSGDVTEGIALLAGGFDSLTFENAVVVVPEPGTLFLMITGLAGISIVTPRRL